MRLYRVLYYDDNAAPHEPGGVLYIPPQGPNRIDNAEHYSVLYVGDSASGVCAEVFYRGVYRTNWTMQMLRPLPSGQRRVLAWYEVADNAQICALDNPQTLLKQHLRPSRVITRDYAVTQQWALDIFQQQRYAGISWWSYCDSRWTTLGLWERDIIEQHGYEELTLKHPALIDAAKVVGVRISP